MNGYFFINFTRCGYCCISGIGAGSSFLRYQYVDPYTLILSGFDSERSSAFSGRCRKRDQTVGDPSVCKGGGTALSEKNQRGGDRFVMFR